VREHNANVQYTKAPAGGPDYTSSPGEVVRRYHRTIAQ